MDNVAAFEQRAPKSAEQDICAMCGGKRLDVVLDLPELPLTGFVRREDYGPPSRFDQALVTCDDCGHFQLLYIVSPEALYGENYVYRTSANQQSATAVESYLAFVEQVLAGRRVRCVLEIGCNDGSTLAQFSDRAQHLVGIDPIWRLDSGPEAPSNLTAIPKFIEDVDLCDELPERPDLVLSCHNLEHIKAPEQQMRRVVETASDDAIFVIEVPALEPMFDHRRFDKVFHEHLHYFSLNALRSMIDRLDCELTHHSVSRTWGGSHQIAFKKSRRGAEVELFRLPGPDRLQIARGYKWFRCQLAAFTEMAENIPGPIRGYGAGQQLPVLAYHLQTDFSFLEGLLDDDPNRTGLGYRTIDLEVMRPDDLPHEAISESAILVTALDSVRPILRRLNDFEPRLVLLPSDVI